MKPVFPDARYPSKLFPPNGPFAPHRCAICGGKFEVGQQFYNYGQGQVVHTKCRFQKQNNIKEQHMTQEALKRITRDDTEHGKEYYLASDVDALLSEVRADEREACAKVCEQGLPIASSLSALDDMEMWGEKFAAAIRARGEQA